jgi:hypothetical protein
MIYKVSGNNSTILQSMTDRREGHRQFPVAFYLTGPKRSKDNPTRSFGLIPNRGTFKKIALSNRTVKIEDVKSNQTKNRFD